MRRAATTARSRVCRHFVWTNRSKESLTLDVKHDAAKEVLARLIGTADVFLQNLAPGAARPGARRGRVAREASAADLVWHFRLRPRGSVCGEEGLRPAGSVRDRPSLGHRYARVTIEGRHPGGGYRRRHVRVLVDPGGAPASRAHRAKGRRSTSRCSRRSGSGWDFRRCSRRTAAARRRARARITPPSFLHGPFKAGDGGTVFLSVQNEREFERFCDVVLKQPAEDRRPLLIRSRAAERRPGDARRNRQGVLATEDRRGDRAARRRTSRTRA